jgi:hypothetical protein
MSIPVHAEPGAKPPFEHCCFCGQPTLYWTSLPDRTLGEQVACCFICAAEGDPSKVPTKKAWCEVERARHLYLSVREASVKVTSRIDKRPNRIGPIDLVRGDIDNLALALQEAARLGAHDEEMSPTDDKEYRFKGRTGEELAKMLCSRYLTGHAKALRVAYMTARWHTRLARGKK